MMTSALGLDIEHPNARFWWSVALCTSLFPFKCFKILPLVNPYTALKVKGILKTHPICRLPTSTLAVHRRWLADATRKRAAPQPRFAGSPRQPLSGSGLGPGRALSSNHQAALLLRNIDGGGGGLLRESLCQPPGRLHPPGYPYTLPNGVIIERRLRVESGEARSLRRVTQPPAALES